MRLWISALSRRLQPTLSRRCLVATLASFEFGFALGETLAHLNYLVTDGYLERRRDDDRIIRYRPAV